jgi:hypothetical protein
MKLPRTNPTVRPIAASGIDRLNTTIHATSPGQSARRFARAVGPALGGVIVAIAGVGSAFLLNTVSFLAVILVVARWKRRVTKRTTPPETVTGATVAAIRYVRYSPAVRVVLFRARTAMFFASGLLALLPTIARSVSGSPIGYGALLGCFGCGAVIGALVLQRVRARWSADAAVSAGAFTS